MADFDRQKPEQAPKLSAAEAEQMTVHLAELAGGELPLGPGLRAAADECRSRRLARVLRELAQRVDRGEPLEKALGAQSRTLPNHIVRLVQAASQSGQLGSALGELLKQHRAIRRIQGEIRAALAYPVLLIAILAGVLLFAAFYIIPPIAQMFEEWELQLPLVSRALVWFSRTGVWVLIALLCAISAGGIASRATRLVGGGALLCRLAAAIPLFGPLWEWSGAAELCRVMSLLLEHRVTLPEALRLASASMTNTDVSETSAMLAEGVEAGRSLSGQLSAAACLPHSLTMLVRWGEDHGALAEAFDTAAGQLEHRIRLRAALIKTIVPPLLFIVIGVIAGFLALGLFSPLFTLVRGLV